MSTNSAHRFAAWAAIAAIVGLVPVVDAREAPKEKPKEAAKPPPLSAELLKGLEFRSIGPAIMGGRVDDVAVVESEPRIFYVATAAGGVFKTTNAGTTFEPVFDDQETSSIGAIAIAPSDPSIVYVGTGEPNNRQSSSWGHGVYRTLDGGKTWTHLGLADTHHIGRVVVHPTNPDVAYVAALGHLWGSNKERGLFRTTDGGRTWTNTKFVDEDTGFVDVAMDPESPQTLYAASYQRRRAPFGYNGGGPGSGLWKTTDGGATWKRLTKGLPADGDVGRIGIAVYRRDPRIVYVTVEHAKEGGVYRSDDKGESFAKTSATNPRPSYYSQIRIDPGNEQRIWVLGAPMFFSEDGGKTFKSDVVQKIHGDYHALWIDPRDSDHMLAGTDGGIHASRDRGRTWDFLNAVPLAQFYEVSLDNRSPYRVYGGLQDNGSWSGPSRTLHQQGIANEDWLRVGGGDGFYCVVDPSDSDIVYVESQDGNVARFDQKTEERRVIRPEAPAGERYRFNWNSPVVVSPHDPRTIYYGGNRVFGSTDRGETWTLKSPDLTAGQERDKLPIFGKPAKEFLSRNDGVVHWGTVTTLAESPRKPGVLWAGTDDGALQVSKDGGATWTNVAAHVPGVPKGTYVSRVEPSRTGDGVAYVSFDGHRGNDFAPYVYRTEDFGQTWKSLAAGLPAGASVHVVREHPRKPSLLFVGTERALWASFDRGGSWQRLSGKLPTVPVFDVQIHPRDGDLVVATHGRGIYVLDDAGPLEQMAPAAVDEDLHVFEPRPAVEWRVYAHKADTGHKTFLAPNPPDGAAITYFLKTKPAEKQEVKVTVADAAGTLVRELKGPKEAGLNRSSWDLRHEPPVARDPSDPAESFLGPPRGPFVPPGTYTVKVAVGSLEQSRTVKVDPDPRITVGDDVRQAWYEASRAAAQLWTRADAANKLAAALKKQIDELQEAFKKRQPPAPDALGAALKAIADKLEPLAKRVSRQNPLGFAGAPLADEPEPLLDRSRGLYMAYSALIALPTPQQKELQGRLTADLDEVARALNALRDTDVAAFNKLVVENGLGLLDPGKKIP